MDAITNVNHATTHITHKLIYYKAPLPASMEGRGTKPMEIHSSTKTNKALCPNLYTKPINPKLVTKINIITCKTKIIEQGNQTNKSSNLLYKTRLHAQKNRR